ncbi:Flp pilus assembly protein TadG [Sphingopyxis panaciterrae]|uniref:TadE/TadG family type IV pilus assembly protein n=1 Tax=Sphingopyxis panaciterrae TaxID=363841 RepID=UPI00142039CC|nr:TadE/TadG family type IV pilus assembly protein [Sphingopyxis panaciterrae]NIJ36904.1 Flp pilus assembly protein TadG [Sphingopyxis panaciterrae]
MTAQTFFTRLARKPASAGLNLMRSERGAAMIEMAIVLPLFIALLMGILVYGQYFLLAHSVQQAANDGARAAIVGLDATDRRAIATRAIDRSLRGAGRLTPDVRTVTISETTEAITVGVAYTVPADSFLRTTIIPVPSNIIRANATFELPVE